MAVTEVTEESWFSRLGGAFKGILTGLILFILAFPLLFWNEGRAVKRAKALETGAAAVVSVQSDKIQPSNEGKLVHVSGMLLTDDTLTDSQFGITIKGIKLSRKVEMFQWKEKTSTKSEKQLGGSVKKTTVYTYEKSWSSSVIDSSRFKEAGHNNPGAFPVESQKWYAGNVKLGAFSLAKGQIERIGDEQPYAFPADYKLPPAFKGKVENGRIVIPAAVPAQAPAAQAPAAQAQTPAAPQAVQGPQVGDIRISYTQIVPHNISIVAQQIKDTFCAYPVKGDSILLMSDSIQSADLMFSKAQSANNMMTWILRIAGFLMMLIGLNMVFKPLSVLGDVIPFIGDLIGMGTSVVSFLIALPCWLICIAIAWLFYRPVLGITLLVLAVGAIILLLKKRKKKQPSAPAAA